MIGLEEFAALHPLWRIDFTVAKVALGPGAWPHLYMPRRITMGQGNGHIVITVADDSGAATAWLDFTELVELIDRDEL